MNMLIFSLAMCVWGWAAVGADLVAEVRGESDRVRGIITGVAMCCFCSSVVGCALCVVQLLV